MRVIKVNMGGQEFEAREEEFEIAREDWNEYKLADGGRVRTKTIVHKLLRVLDAEGKPAYDQNGDPHIIVRSALQVVSSE